MLKIVNILLVSLFLFTPSGISLNIHYCGSNISISVFGFNINGSKDCCCDHNEISHDDDCCRSETKIIKSENQKILTSVLFKLNKPFEVILLAFYKRFDNQKLIEERLFPTKIKHPPPKSTDQLFLKNRILLI